MRILMAQINPTVGDLAANTECIVRNAKLGSDRGFDLVVFPELAICGYPPRDLLDREAFLAACAEGVAEVVAATRDLNCGVIFGYPRRRPQNTGKKLANSLMFAAEGRVLASVDKTLLPTYDVFDEWRYFEPAVEQRPVEFRGKRLALAICEDVWNDKQFWERPLYAQDPILTLMAAGADALITINASPYHLHKRKLRQEMIAAIARRSECPVLFCAQVGGNDQLVFDGSSFAISADGSLLASGKSFEEDLIEVDLEQGTGSRSATFEDEAEAAYQALVMGTRDYLQKCGFGKVLIGLSGGIDSSITACVAVDAVGRENVIGVGMPGPYSSDHSVADARAMAERLGIRFELISINGPYQEMVRTLAPVFEGWRPDVTEENLQSRLRGMTLMALSNKFGALVLTTGNKSELAVGYCTLYGDMCGGLAVISDVPKTMVYELSRVANRRHGNAIPENVFVKPPSAELRPDQKDSDSLPEYDILDKILESYIEDNLPVSEIAALHGLDVALVRDIARKVNLNEYKRQQAAPGLRITSKAFGMGRRYPIAQRFRE